MTKAQANKNIFYFELVSKPNVDIDGVAVSMWKNMSLKQSLVLITSWIFNMGSARDLGLEKEHTLWE